MSLWGVSANVEAQPLYLSSEQKETTYATPEGWVYQNPLDSGQKELLVAVQGLEAALGKPNPISMEWGTRAAADDPIEVTFRYNSRVNVVAGAHIFMQYNGNSVSKARLDFSGYVGGANSNQIIFSNNLTNVTAAPSNTYKVQSAISGTVRLASTPATPAIVDLTKGGAGAATDIRTTTVYTITP